MNESKQEMFLQLLQEKHKVTTKCEMNQYHTADIITMGHTVVQTKGTNILPTPNAFLLMEILLICKEAGLNVFLL